MTERKQILPAFPGESATHYFTGMSMRDYFAAQALVPLIRFYEPDVSTTPKDIVAAAYQYADLMLEAQEKNS